MVAYFFTTAAARPVQLEGRTYKFVPLTILGGRISGVFDTSDETDIAILRRAVVARCGISEMSEAEADDVKKKMQTRRPSRGLSPLESKPPKPVATGPLLAMAATAGTVASAEKPKPNGEITLPRITSMVHVGKVRPPQPLVAEKDRMLRGRLGK